MGLTVEKVWELLNRKGVYTMEEFKKFQKENELDYGIFISPIEIPGQEKVGKK